MDPGLEVNALLQIREDREVMLEDPSQGGLWAQPFSEAVLLLPVQSLLKVQTLALAVLSVSKDTAGETEL